MKWYLFPALRAKFLGANGPRKVEGAYKDLNVCLARGSRWADPTFCICQKCGAINRQLDRNRTYGISNTQWQKNVEEMERLMEGKKTPLSDMPPWESK